MQKNTKRAGDGAWCVKSQPHSYAGTVPRPFGYAQGKQAQDDTLSPDNGGVSGPDYSPSASSGFRRATPGPIQHRRWYRVRSL